LRPAAEKLSLVHSYVLPGYLGLMYDSDYGFFNRPAEVGGAVPISMLNLCLTWPMKQAGLAKFYEGCAFRYIQRLIVYRRDLIRVLF
jgi:hypothetical protein